ncbi:hypothetical protein QE441_002333 [Chryseobacterium sp. SORGH_AS909]|uniref:Secreted protein n=1 Tax=Chryseobacterium camelliae TaxID=1265445 RepID=A0ABU0TE30_9FLAO|nr:hypothetical protein [Chryseobacterium camelliae]MDQ1099190.1 hypothetical protein [Chryseobacterium sp. SORGH_AS_1048]MDR6086539.1 hypothetical protein [Chryseobacterium sp. SORGH_AS_0909]MDR6130910.1 hypothetical protein [Chryseobacterium sp. SORGH_AS_1175]MDT3406955.1 hypothetical protein [Pseudacidovorax intermedius]
MSFLSLIHIVLVFFTFPPFIRCHLISILASTIGQSIIAYDEKVSLLRILSSGRYKTESSPHRIIAFYNYTIFLNSIFQHEIFCNFGTENVVCYHS